MRGLLVALPLLLAGPAVAQDGGAGTSSASAAKNQLSETQDALREMRGVAEYISDMLAKAENEGEPVKVQCINKKLATVRALVEVSESAALSMQEALADGNDARADYEYRKINVALTKARQARAEADACLGDEGDPETQTVVDYDEEEAEESIDAGNIDIGVDPPGTSSFE
ncbi:MAG: hypothetical protein H6739_16995 [Alphaproteobacteria bacterium]|nr:hypothetical protein [Alphaproteobacteria bacterium]